MKYATEMGLGAMIYIPGFIKTGSGILKLMGEEGLTHRHHGDCTNVLEFFQNKESRLIIGVNVTL
jgi:hypothetical protein